MKPTREEYVRDIRKLADVLEKYQWVPLPDAGQWDWSAITFSFYSSSDIDVEVKSQMAGIRKLLGGRWDKKPEGDYYALLRANGLKFRISTYRERVCEKKIVGQKVTQRPVYVGEPEVSHYEEVVEDIVEWVCPETIGV